MSQMLPRGCKISDDNKIKKMIAKGTNWQIYFTNQDAYVLAVTFGLYQTWVSNYFLPEAVFLDDRFQGCRVFISSGDYIISSLDKGPYPENSGQVEAFSIAFNTAVALDYDADFYDAIYIEEYSLVLPTTFGQAKADNKIVYGKWLTGGVEISINSIDRIEKIMSWLPQESLLKSSQMAGFEILTDDMNEVDIVESVVEESVTPKEQEPLALYAESKFVLIGRPELEQFFNDNIIDIILHQEQYKKMGIPFPGATILYGPPGCGKTYAVDRLSEFLGWQRFDIDSSTIASSYIHDTSRKISEVFCAAIKSAPSILVIDEMEAFLTDRGLAGLSGTHHVEEVAEFLRRIPEAISKGVLVFAMTNMIDTIDPAILRRGRFDHIVEVKMANAEEIAALLKNKFAEIPVDETVNIVDIARKLDCHPLSDVTFILREAGRFAVKNNLDVISEVCFSYALNLLPQAKERSKIGFVT